MTTVFIFLVSFAASVLGSACGLGGGVIIKPAIDAINVFSVSTVSFLSGCTVMTMSAYNVLRNLTGGKNQIDLRQGTFLGIGAAVGGIAGKLLFEYIRTLFGNPEKTGAVQALTLFFVLSGILLYSIKKERILTLHIQNGLISTAIGLALGAVSTFLGIGGGPINLAVLSFFFSMDTKDASQNSLYIILISQLGSLLMLAVTERIPLFTWPVLIGMMCSAVLGGAVGRKINQTTDANSLDKLFLVSIVIIMFICLYNFFHFIN